ncbi:hypothetical protein D046_0326B, partial [Vibrio parahaemolyticus V-223/04]
CAPHSKIDELADHEG